MCITIIIIISFLLDGVVASFIQPNSFFIPLFSLLSLLLIFPYFNDKNKNFIIAAGIIGCFYDIVYMDSLFLNALVFILLAVLITQIFAYLPVNILNTYVVSLVAISTYRILVFSFLALIMAIPFDLIHLSNSITHSVLANTLYILTGYLLVGAIAKRYKIRKNNKI